jgi:hypothetical protein
MITKNDYIKILDFYKIAIPDSQKLLKQKAESILANKLCRCIKKIDPINETKSIGICTKTIFNRKGFTRGKFQCNKKKTVSFRKIKNNKKNTKKNIKK